MSKTEPSEAVTNFVAERVAGPGKRVATDTRLAEDLGLDGLDAIEFLEAFSKRFDVNVADFPFDEYFGPEAFDPIAKIVHLIRRRHRRRPLRVYDLIAATREGVLR